MFDYKFKAILKHAIDALEKKEKEKEKEKEEKKKSTTVIDTTADEKPMKVENDKNKEVVNINEISNDDKKLYADDTDDDNFFDDFFSDNGDE